MPNFYLGLSHRTIECSELYIGETGRRLSEPVREHLCDIRKRRAKEVAVHFNGPDHSIADFGVCGLIQVEDAARRKLLEAKLIKKLGTLHPFGMNREEESWHRLC